MTQQDKQQAARLLVVAHDKYRNKPIRQDELKARYPLIIRALKSLLIGTDSEATCTLSCYRQGIACGPEACSHSGLTTADRLVMCTSSRFRAMVRQEYKLYSK